MLELCPAGFMQRRCACVYVNPAAHHTDSSTPAVPTAAAVSSGRDKRGNLRAHDLRAGAAEVPCCA
jgi:hypothetical protein